MERAPLTPWQLELAADVSVNSQVPSVWCLKLSATAFVIWVTPSICQLSRSAAPIDEGRRMTVATLTLDEQLKVDGENVTLPDLEPMVM